MNIQDAENKAEHIAETITTYINGNISVFTENIKKMPMLEIMALMKTAKEMYPDHDIASAVHRALTRI